MKTGRKANEEEVEEVVEEAEKYTLPNHLFWGLWGIISVSHFKFLLICD